MKKYNWLKLFAIVPFLAVLAQAQAAHSSTFTWAAVTGAQGYNLYKAPGSCTATFVKVNSTPITLLTYTDTGMLDGEVNCYYLKAFDANGESDPSGTMLITTPTIVATKVKISPPVPRWQTQ